MRRTPVPVRTAWRENNAAAGLVYNDTHLDDGSTVSYWREGSAYAFTVSEINELEQAASTLYAMLLEAGTQIVESCPRKDREVRADYVLGSICESSGCFLFQIGVPEFAHEQIIRTWCDDDAEAWDAYDKNVDASGHASVGGPGNGSMTTDYSPNIYGRFDLRYDGSGPPKLLEFNAQTPTSLLEAAVIQWFWQEQTAATDHPERQWNSIHEALIAGWKRNMTKLAEARPWLGATPLIHFAYEDTEESGEDQFNVAYMAETAAAAGYRTKIIAMSSIGHDMATDSITHDGEPIDVVFALYPWEWIWNEEGGRPIFRNMADPQKRGTVWINPPYTAALLGNKAVLAVLWKMFGDDPRRAKYLLPAYMEKKRPAGMRDYALKPIWGREGASTQLVRGGRELETRHGIYGREGFVVQELCELPAFDAVEGTMHPVIGVWMVDGEPVGMGIRESAELITGNTSHFVPHIIEEG